MKKTFALLLLFHTFSAAYSMIPSSVCDSTGVVLSEFIYDKAEFPSCHAATIAETSEGVPVIAFFGGKYESNSDCSIWMTRHIGGKWETPVLVADGMVDSVKTACWNPVLFQIPDGKLLLFYKVGSSVQEWTGWFMKSDDGGASWSEPERLPDGILGPIKNKPVLVGDRLLCGTSLERGGWRAYVDITDTELSRWRTVGPLNNRRGRMQMIQPSFLRHADGTLQMLCRSIDLRGNIITLFSRDGGETWSEPVSTGLPNNDSGLDAVTLKDGRFMLVYNHIQARHNGAAARSPLNVAISDNGKDWYAALTLEDSPGEEFSYPSVIQTEDSLVHIVYTWHRKCIKHVILDPSMIRIDPARMIKDEEWVDDRRRLESEYADSVAGLMTIREKMDLLSGKWIPHDRGTHDLYAGGNDRLGLPRFRMEYAPAGIHTNGKSTSYPCPLALAASFDPLTVKTVAASIAEDAAARGIGAVAGPDLSPYSPEIPDLQANTFGDNPAHIVRCAIAFAEGLNDAGAMPVARFSPAGGTSKRILAETLPHYGGVMLRGETAGVKAVEDTALNCGLIRGTCGFDGLLISDIGETESALNAFKAGINIDLPNGECLNAESIGELLEEGLISPEEIDSRAREILAVMHRYGLTDKENKPDFGIPENRLESREISYEAALKCMVLLENKGNILPLTGKEKKVLVLGNRVYRNSESTSTASVYTFGQTVLADLLEGREGYNLLPESREYIDLTLAGEFFTDRSLKERGLTAAYSDDMETGGTPRFVRTEKYIDYAWGSHPSINGTPASWNRVRWTGIYRPESETIARFGISGSGKIRLYIDGKEVCSIDGKRGEAADTPYLFVAKKGRTYELTVEFEATCQDPEIQLTYAPVRTGDNIENLMKEADRIILSIGSDGPEDRDMEFWSGLVGGYGRKTIVVMQACDLSDMEWCGSAAAVLLAWHSGQYAGKAIAEILSGDAAPTGKMPIGTERYPFGYGLTYKE